MDPFVGEIRLFGFPRVPIGWLACDGSIQQISQFDVLYALIGTTYGGDGNTTFGLPDLRGRVPLSQGTGKTLSPRVIGQMDGKETHTLRETEMASHSHALVSSTSAGSAATPGPTMHLATANPTSFSLYAPQAGVASYAKMAASIMPAGNNLPHDNMMPTLTCNFCIAYQGIFPQTS